MSKRVAQEKFQDALGTAEEGAALVEVARNAHRAEQKLARIFRLIDTWGDGNETLLVNKVAGICMEP